MRANDMNDPAHQRYCPTCGVTTDESFCSADGTQTVARAVLKVEAATLREGDVIDGRYRVLAILGRDRGGCT